MSGIDSLIDDFVARLRKGDEPDVEEYARKYPDLANEIRDVFPALRMLERVDVIAADVNATEPPRQLNEYMILREVGRGGMGVVYEAVQQSLGRHVALKVLHAGLNTRPEHFERFRREARAVAALHHTNIVPVFGVGEQDGVHYYAMQFIRGQTLAAVIAELRGQHGRGTAITATSSLHLDGNANREFKVGALSSTTAQWSTITTEYFRGIGRIGAQTADALDYAHRRGIVHRDVKPGNLLLDQSGTLWVTDFGLAKASESEALTATGDVLGTLAYMAPEQFTGAADGRTDVYALGLVLYELATLTPAFQDSVRIRLIDKVRRGNPPSPRSIEPRMPIDLQTIVLKAIAPNPNDRYPNAAAMADDLRRFVSGRSIFARRTTWIGQAWRWSKRNRAVASLLAAVLSLLLIVAIGGTLAAIINERESRRARQAETEAIRRAWHAQLEEANAITSSGRAGQRVEALRILSAALDAARSQGPLDPDIERAFRNVAVAALTLPDIERVPIDSDDVRSLPHFYTASNERRTLHVIRNGFADPIASIEFPKQRLGYVIDPRSGRAVTRTLDGDEGLTIWDASVSPPRRLGDFPGRFLGLPIVSRDGRYVACAIDRASAAVFKVETKERWMIQIGDGPNPSYAMTFAPDGSLTYPQFDRRMCQLRRWKNGESVDLPVPPFEGSVMSLSWDERGRRLAIADESRFARVCDMHLGEIGARHEHATRGLSVYISPAGTHLFTLDRANTLRIWEVGSGRLHVSTTLEAGSFIPIWERQTFLVVRGGQVVEVIRFHPGQELVRCVHNQGERVWGVGLHGAWFSPTDNLIAASLIRPESSELETGVILVDPRTGLPLESIEDVHQHTASFLEDGSLLTTGFDGITHWPRIRERNGIVFGPPQVTAPRQAVETNGVTWLGKSVIFARTNALRVVRPDHTESNLPLGFNTSRQMEVSPDGQWFSLIRGNSITGRAVQVRKMADLSLAVEVKVDGPPSHGFSPDGRWFWAGGMQTRLWEVGTWNPGPTLDGRRAAIDAESRIAATDSGNGTVRVIDLHSGEERLRLTTPDREPLLPLAFSGDGRRLTAVSLDSRRLLIWDRQEIQRGLARYGLAETIGSQHGNGDLANEIRVNLGPFRDRYLAWRALERRQDFVQAASHLRDAIAKHPDDHDSRIRLVQICLFGPAEVRDVAFAEKLCDELLARIQSTAPEQRSFLPTLSMTSALRAGVEFRREKYADALAWLEKSNRNPSSSFTSHLLLRGLSLHRLGQTEQAKRYLEDCDQLIYWESNNNHWLGILYRNLREEPGNPPTTLRR